MSTEMIPADPTRGSRIFSRITRDRLSASAARHAGYRSANLLVDAIASGLTAGVEASLDRAGVDVVGFELVVPADGEPFPGVTGTVGLTVLWLPKTGATATTGPFLYLFAIQGAGGPEQLGPVLNEPVAGSLFVGHFAGDEADVRADSLCESVAVTTSALWNLARRPIRGELVAYGVPGGVLLLDLEDVWYLFGGRLTIRGSDGVIAGYDEVRYRHFEWLLDALGLRDTTGGTVSLPRHRFAKAGARSVPQWAPGPRDGPVSGEIVLDPPAEWVQRARTWRDAFVRIAEAEEDDWTTATGEKKVEGDADRLPNLEAYYGTVMNATAAKVEAGRAARDQDPWSAVFISYVVEQAGVTRADGFEFSVRHITFTVHALANRLNHDFDRPFWLYRVDEITPEPGDILCLNRKVSGNCTGHTFDSLRRRISLDTKTNRYEVRNPYGSSHTDIVVERIDDGGTTYVETVGGNAGDLSGVEDTVGRKRWKLDADGHVEHQVDRTDTRIADQCDVFGLVRVVPSEN